VSGIALHLPAWLAHVPTYVPPVDTTALNAPAWSPLWHPGSPVRFLPTYDWTGFGIHWSTVIGIAVLSAIYVYWMAGLRRRRGLEAAGDGWRITAFVTAQIVMFFSLNGPIHDLSDYYLFSAHMVQHLLLILIWAPLLILSVPPWAQAMILDWGRVGRAIEWAAKPVPAFTFFSVAFMMWHLQLLYGIMMRDHNVHIATHVMFMVTSVLLWWPVCQSAPGRPAMSDPLKMLYLFLITLPMMPVAAFISLATDVLYPWYTVAPRVFGLSPLADQAAGGLIMWVPGNAVLWVAITVIFFRWALGQEKNERTRAPSPESKGEAQAASATPREGAKPPESEDPGLVLSSSHIGPSPGSAIRRLT
jgi:putative membrane protein